MMKITGLQLVEDALKQELSKLQGAQVALVGIHEAAGMHESGDLTVAAVGAYNHFGVPDKIPARPWLDVGVDTGTKEYLETIEEGIAEGLDSKQILEQVGALAVGYTQQFITDLRDPPNADSTIKKKGSDNPLIDTGNLRQSVTYSVVRNVPSEGLE
ncbi:hypothetical protein CASP1_00062 [Alcaligenes phage CASP1]|nr:hypothetical protein CASP1_00062 [Alcaligenes phage CASP1]